MYPTIWLEYQVNGKAGKFLKDEMLTTHIAYSHRSQTTVQMFSYQEMQWFVKANMDKGNYEQKTATSRRGDRAWTAKGLIILTDELRTHIRSYEMVFGDR